MTIKLSDAVRNARLNAIEAAIGASPKLRLFTGAAPANTAAANSGTVLATIDLPADWMQDAAGGTKAMAGAWKDNEADGTGDAAHFRIFAADGVTCHIQGTVGNIGSLADMELNNVSFRVGQEFTISGFTLNEPNG